MFSCVVAKQTRNEVAVIYKEKNQSYLVGLVQCIRRKITPYL